MLKEQEKHTQELQKEDDQSTDKRPHRIFGLLSSRAAEWVGVGVTIASGVTAALNSIRVSFYRNFSRYEPFKGLKYKRNREYTELFKEFPTRSFNSIFERAREFVKSIIKIEDKYKKDFAKTLYEQYGINDSNILDRWSTLKTPQRWEVFLTFAGVSTVLMGVVASISASRRVEDRQQGFVEQLKSMNEKMDAITAKDQQNDLNNIDKQRSFVEELSTMNQRLDELNHVHNKPSHDEKAFKDQPYVERLKATQHIHDSPNESLAI